MRRTRTVAPLQVVLLLGMLVLGLTPAAARQESSSQILRINWGEVPETLDPQLSYFGQWAMSGLDFEGLTRVDEELQIVPAAAESWAFSDDGLTLTFALREGLVFSDGAPLTAEHFRYAAERICSPQLDSRSATYLFAVIGCEELFTSLGAASATPGVTADAVTAARARLGVDAIDDRTLEIRLKEPAPYLPAVAALWPFVPLRQDLVEAGGDEWWADPGTRVGNGPFRLESLVREGPDAHVHFARSDRYWRGRAKLDGITFTALEPDAAFAAYQRGELEVIWPGEDRMPSIEADPVLSREIVSLPAPGLGFYTFNLTREPFQDKKVREAFAYAFDREAYCREMNYGSCAPTYSWIPPGQPGAIETDAYAFDPAKARQALVESTYGGPENLPEITWYAVEGDEGDAIEAEWFRQMFRQVLGVELTIAFVSEDQIDALYDGASATYPQFAGHGWFADLPDPVEWFPGSWDCQGEHYAKRVGYCNPELDALIAQADAQTDPERRLALYEEVGRLFVADAPALFAHTEYNVMLVKPYVVDYSRTTPNWNFPGWTDLVRVDLAPHEAEGAPPTSPESGAASG
jgi:oligopeptide transport system substrate-binding protein